MLLFRMVNYYQSKNILELGTSLGIGTSYLALANPAATITSIEGSKTIADYAMKNFKAYQIQNVQQVVGNFDTVLPDVLANNPLFDFVFIDGNHQYHPTLNYFNLLITKVAEEAILVFDDIHWSPGMKQAWQEIAADTRVKLSVDVFQFGIVFINKNFKEKQHFIIKY
jgi:predicted O-methyltransferase YrrM